MEGCSALVLSSGDGRYRARGSGRLGDRRGTVDPYHQSCTRCSASGVSTPPLLSSHGHFPPCVPATNHHHPVRYRPAFCLSPAREPLLESAPGDLRSGLTVRMTSVLLIVVQGPHVSVHAEVSGFEMSLERGCAIVFLNTQRRHKTCTSEIMVELAGVPACLCMSRNACLSVCIMSICL
jgi:hypothetical protein